MPIVGFHGFFGAIEVNAVVAMVKRANGAKCLSKSHHGEQFPQGEGFANHFQALVLESCIKPIHARDHGPWWELLFSVKVQTHDFLQEVQKA
jgi:hypothetical protein